MGMILKDSDGNPIFWPDGPELVVDPLTENSFVERGYRANMLPVDDWCDKTFSVKIIDGKVVVDEVIDERDIS